MSGIVGLARHGGPAVDRSLLRRMTDAMAFRGPDAREVWSLDGPEVSVGLGCALLRTTPEEGPLHQPTTLDGDVWIAADVRLDGRAELCAALARAGRAAASDAPDVALVLLAYRVWGERCVEHLSGEFAFVLWDGPERRLFCARDQFGVVPFYYVTTADGFACSNTLSCLRLHPEVSATLDERAVTDTLLFGSNQDWDTTQFADIRALPPAHALSHAAGRLRVVRYWALGQARDYVRYPDPRDYVERFRELFEQATRDRLRTRSAGVLMSGGLDSTSVAAAAQRTLAATGTPFRLEAYCWVYERLMPDQERRYAELAADALGIPIRILVADAGDDATGDGGPSPLQQIAGFGRVALSGQGGDAAVQPDADYWIRMVRRGHVGQLASDVLAHVRLDRRRPPLYLRRIVDRWRGRPVWRPWYPRWIRPDVAEAMKLQQRLAGITDERLSDRGRTGMVSPFWANVLANRDPDHTRVPVRVRHPFFDVRLLRYLSAIPPVPWFIDKRILREATAGILPDAVRLRPKAPMPTWPHHALAIERGVPAWMDDLAATPELGRWIDLVRLRQDLYAPGTLAPHQYQAAMRAIGLATWLRRHGLAEVPQLSG